VPEPVYVVFNPQSGRGRGARLIAPVLSALRAAGGEVEHGATTRPGEEAELATAAIARGIRRVVAVGGDGTWGNVANAVLRSGQPVTLGIIPGGTGSDLAKSLGIPGKDLAACARIVRNGHVRSMDVGRIEDKYFLNVAGFGYDIAVIEDSWRVRWLSGGLVYQYCALRQLGAFPGFPVEIEIDGVPAGREDLLMLILANGRVFGGGFQIAPRADVGDGRLDAMAFRNMGVLRRLGLMARLLRGTHEGSPVVKATTARTYRLRFQAPPAYETDGEWNQARSAEITVETVPGALRVLVPAPPDGPGAAPTP
jgi:diacylglycerol kinase (ATP)